MFGLEISFQEVGKVIFYKSDYCHALTEIRCVCGIGKLGSVNGCYGKSVLAADIKKPPGWRLAVIFLAFLHLSVFL